MAVQSLPAFIFSLGERDLRIALVVLNNLPPAMYDRIADIIIREEVGFASMRKSLTVAVLAKNNTFVQFDINNSGESHFGALLPDEVAAKMMLLF